MGLCIRAKLSRFSVQKLNLALNFVKKQLDEMTFRILVFFSKTARNKIVMELEI